jgi:hypothetical protein
VMRGVYCKLLLRLSGYVVVGDKRGVRFKLAS